MEKLSGDSEEKQILPPQAVVFHHLRVRMTLSRGQDVEAESNFGEVELVAKPATAGKLSERS